MATAARPAPANSITAPGPHWGAKPILAVSAAAGLLAGVFVWNYYTNYAPGLWSDFDQIWLGAHALLAGRDPYEAVPTRFPWPLYYPVPALLLGLPFAPWPLPVARIAFAVVTATFCTWTVLRFHPVAAPLLLSAPFVYAIQRGQWSPLLVAAAIAPMASAPLAAKPSVGLAIFAYRPTWTALIQGVALGLVALTLLPSWPLTWLRTAGEARHLIAPVMLPGGFLLLLALLRWRQPEARLLTVLACVPQTSAIYELFPLALIPHNRRLALALTLSLNILYIATLESRRLPLIVAADTATGFYPIYWPAFLALGYLPALAMVLMPRDRVMGQTQ